MEGREAKEERHTEEEPTEQEKPQDGLKEALCPFPNRTSRVISFIPDGFVLNASDSWIDRKQPHTATIYGKTFPHGSPLAAISKCHCLPLETQVMPKLPGSRVTVGL